MSHPTGMMFLPYPGPPPAPPPESHPDPFRERIPVRVLMAFRYIDMISDISKPIVATASSDSQVEIERFDVPQPDIDMLRARSGAADLLCRYFRGEFEPADWEKPPEPEKGDGLTRTVVRCLQCGGRRSMGSDPCNLCMGYGHLIVSPANPEGV